VVHYDKEAAEHGCAVDLLLKESNEIDVLFTAEVTRDYLGVCMKVATEDDIPPDNNMSVFLHSSYLIN
jgi:hypothetical protein